ncbi:MAG: protein kinase, partial [Candidatus Latescibacteria bacterium]|nr:protein kinase [Candidatus Latescibacterota bacterium]
MLQSVILDDLRDADRFRREASIAAKLSHPNIVSVYGAGAEGGYLYMAMELVRGRSLR